MGTQDEFGRLDAKERKLIAARRKKNRQERRENRREDRQEIRNLRRELKNNDKGGGTGTPPKEKKVEKPRERAMETLKTTKSLAAGETLTLTWTLPDDLEFDRITARGDDDGRLLSIKLGRRNMHASNNGLSLSEMKSSNLQAADFKGYDGGKGDILTVQVQASDKDKIIDINIYGWWTSGTTACG